MILSVFFNLSSTTEIYSYCHTFSLHVALPISYSYAGGKLPWPANASELGGIQPVVSASIDGKARAEVAVGDEFTLSAAAEVPAGQGTIVAVEWDFDGTGRFPVAEEGVDGTAESWRYERHHSYDKPGTYFAIVRVTAHQIGRAHV